VKQELALLGTLALLPAMIGHDVPGQKTRLTRARWNALRAHERTAAA